MDYRSGASDTYYLRSTDRGATWESEPAGRSRRGRGRGTPPDRRAGRQRPRHHLRRSGRQSFMQGIGPIREVPGRSRHGRARRRPHLSAEISSTSARVWRSRAARTSRWRRLRRSSSTTTATLRATTQRLFVVRSFDDGRTWGTPVQLTSAPGESDHGSIIGYGATVHLACTTVERPGIARSTTADRSTRVRPGGQMYFFRLRLTPPSERRSSSLALHRVANAVARVARADQLFITVSSRDGRARRACVLARRSDQIAAGAQRRRGAARLEK